MEQHQGRPTILIVEDENLVRMETADVFDEAGFEVVEAWSGTMALETIENDPRIQIVFTDIEMPGGMSGIDLMKTIAHRWPEIPVMMCSGSINLAARKLYQQIPFFFKPYDFSQACSTAQRLIA